VVVGAALARVLDFLLGPVVALFGVAADADEGVAGGEGEGGEEEGKEFHGEMIRGKFN